MGEEASDLSWALLKLYFTNARILTLWVPAFVLAGFLRVITHKYHHQLIFPACMFPSLDLSFSRFPLRPSDVAATNVLDVTDFVALPIIFYIAVFAGGFSIDHLRQSGWVFNVGESREPWYKFYTQFGEFHVLLFFQ